MSLEWDLTPGWHSLTAAVSVCCCRYVAANGVMAGTAFDVARQPCQVSLWFVLVCYFKDLMLHTLFWHQAQVSRTAAAPNSTHVHTSHALCSCRIDKHQMSQPCLCCSVRRIRLKANALTHSTAHCMQHYVCGARVRTLHQPRSQASSACACCLGYWCSCISFDSFLRPLPLSHTLHTPPCLPCTAARPDPDWHPQRRGPSQPRVPVLPRPPAPILQPGARGYGVCCSRSCSRPSCCTWFRPASEGADQQKWLLLGQVRYKTLHHQWPRHVCKGLHQFGSVVGLVGG